MRRESVVCFGNLYIYLLKKVIRDHCANFRFFGPMMQYMRVFWKSALKNPFGKMDLPANTCCPLRPEGESKPAAAMANLILR